MVYFFLYDINIYLLAALLVNDVYDLLVVSDPAPGHQLHDLVLHEAQPKLKNICHK